MTTQQLFKEIRESIEEVLGGHVEKEQDVVPDATIPELFDLLKSNLRTALALNEQRLHRLQFASSGQREMDFAASSGQRELELPAVASPIHPRLDPAGQREPEHAASSG